MLRSSVQPHIFASASVDGSMFGAYSTSASNTTRSLMVADCSAMFMIFPFASRVIPKMRSRCPR